MYVLDQFYKFDVYFFCIYIYTFLSVGFSKCKQCVCENILLSLYFLLHPPPRFCVIQLGPSENDGQNQCLLYPHLIFLIIRNILIFLILP